MSFTLPADANVVVLQSRTNVERSLVGSNPSLENSWLNALVTADANAIFDFYIQLEQAIKLNFPDTTFGEFLDRWSSIYGVSRTPATQSSGNVVLTGAASSVIPSGTGFQSSDGTSYLSTASSTITAQSLDVTSIIRTGSTAVVTTTADHNIASNVIVTISGATQSEYNGAQEITVTGANTFQYSVAGTPTTPATGTKFASFTSANVPIQSVEFETDSKTVNQPLDAVLTLGSPISGVNNNVNVDFSEIGGGITQESDSDLRARFLNRIQNPVAHFSISDIDSQAKTVPGVTRVFVQSITPSVGQVTIYFMRDNDDDPIPSAGEVATVKDKILEITPANTKDSDVIVSAPSAVSTAFTFSALSPNTSTMQAAISANLAQFFSEETEVGLDVDEVRYSAAITNSIDLETGDRVLSFVLTAPSGDISISTGQIATLGSITYP